MNSTSNNTIVQSVIDNPSTVFYVNNQLLNNKQIELDKFARSIDQVYPPEESVDYSVIKQSIYNITGYSDELGDFTGQVVIGYDQYEDGMFYKVLISTFGQIH